MHLYESIIKTHAPGTKLILPWFPLSSHIFRIIHQVGSLLSVKTRFPMCCCDVPRHSCRTNRFKHQLQEWNILYRTSNEKNNIAPEICSWTFWRMVEKMIRMNWWGEPIVLLEGFLHLNFQSHLANCMQNEKCWALVVQLDSGIKKCHETYAKNTCSTHISGMSHPCFILPSDGFFVMIPKISMGKPPRYGRHRAHAHKHAVQVPREVHWGRTWNPQMTFVFGGDWSMITQEVQRPNFAHW